MRRLQKCGSLSSAGAAARWNCAQIFLCQFTGGCPDPLSIAGIAPNLAPTFGTGVQKAPMSGREHHAGRKQTQSVSVPHRGNAAASIQPLVSGDKHRGQ